MVAKFVAKTYIFTSVAVFLSLIYIHEPWLIWDPHAPLHHLLWPICNMATWRKSFSSYSTLLPPSMLQKMVSLNVLHSCFIHRRCMDFLGKFLESSWQGSYINKPILCMKCLWMKWGCKTSGNATCSSLGEGASWHIWDSEVVRTVTLRNLMKMIGSSPATCWDPLKDHILRLF